MDYKKEYSLTFTVQHLSRKVALHFSYPTKIQSISFQVIKYKTKIRNSLRWKRVFLQTYL
ncbi:hypothetical protein LGAA44_120123 [Leuconostoc gasicomitatum]|nr:hypothetical protein LGAA44_120123 [Leuconostoc gasicomitatum]